MLEVQECVKAKKQQFVSRCKVSRLKDGDVRKRFAEQVKDRAAERSESGVEGVWNGLKSCLLEVSDDVCGRSKGR